MGLFQKAVETYDCNQKLVGVARGNSETLAPISHTLTRAHIEITIDKEGIFRAARQIDEKEPRIIIPVTEESLGRVGGVICPHPLCDQIKYLAPYSKEAFDTYLKNLDEWRNSEFTHPIIKAVYHYIYNKSIVNDLRSLDLIKLDKEGNPSDEKVLICWRVIGLDNNIEPCSYLNKELFNLFIEFYNKKIQSHPKNICYINGLNTSLANQHPKGIIARTANAKIISSNNPNIFTFKGRFKESWQAVTISYEASQKAHNALKWLVSNQSVSFISGGRTFLCWNPQGIKIPSPRFSFRKDKEAKYKPSDYKDNLMATLLDFKKDNQLKGNEIAVIAFFDAANQGRLGLTYYNEISLVDFLNHQKNWEEYCCWYNNKYGIQSPNLLSIIDCAYGIQKKSDNNKEIKLETGDKIKGQLLQRLMSVKLNGGNIPLDFVKALTQRASTPIAYEKEIWREIMFTACAVLQKYRHDTHKGGNEMAWELSKQDRSFQFGRLLAILEWAEDRFYLKEKELRQAIQKEEEEKSKEGIRQTNAIKSMEEFRRRPWHVFERINRVLYRAYIPRIKDWQKRKYEILKGEIVSIIKSFPEEDLNKPLDDVYLMGYELQRNEFFKKSDNTSMEEQK